MSSGVSSINSGWGRVGSPRCIWEHGEGECVRGCVCACGICAVGCGEGSVGATFKRVTAISRGSLITAIGVEGRGGGGSIPADHRYRLHRIVSHSVACIVPSAYDLHCSSFYLFSRCRRTAIVPHSHQDGFTHTLFHRKLPSIGRVQYVVMEENEKVPIMDITGRCSGEAP